MLRVLLPNQQGHFPEGPYSMQMDRPSDGIPLAPLQYELTDITGAQDVHAFLDAPRAHYGQHICPDDTLAGHITEATGQQLFSKAEAAHLNKLMEQCFSVCLPTVSEEQTAIRAQKQRGQWFVRRKHNNRVGRAR